MITLKFTIGNSLIKIWNVGNTTTNTTGAK